jgi:hypothetical protein
MDVSVVGNIITVISKRRRVKRKQPNCGDPQVLEIVQLLGQPPEVPHTVSVAIVKRPNVDLVYNGVFVPEGVIGDTERPGSGVGHLVLLYYM